MREDDDALQILVAHGKLEKKRQRMMRGDGDEEDERRGPLVGMVNRIALRAIMSVSLKDLVESLDVLSILSNFLNKKS